MVHLTAKATAMIFRLEAEMGIEDYAEFEAPLEGARLSRERIGFIVACQIYSRFGIGINISSDR